MHRRAWLLGFTAATTMVIAGFTPWFEGGRAGIYTSIGQLGITSGLLAMGLWLLHLRRLAALGIAAGAGVVVWLYTQHSSGAITTWALWLYLTAALISVLAALPGAGARSEARESIEAWLFRRLNPEGDDDRKVDTLIIALIAVNVVAVMLETEPAIADRYADALLINEMIATVVFSVEYVLRLYCAHRDPAYRGRLFGRLRYALSMLAVIDLIAIAPFFLQFIEMDLRVARAIRLMRLVRVFKLGRYARAVRTLANSINRKKEELAISAFFSVLVLVLCSSAMYFVEHTHQPEAFRSIPSTMWWSVVTLTSVGYGDVSPVTGVGQVVGAVVCILGVFVVALPTGIIASGFLEEMRAQRQERDAEVFGYCPHCGKALLPDHED